MLCALMVASCLALTGCASPTAQDSRPYATETPADTRLFDFGQTVQVAEGVYAAVFPAGQGEASSTAAGASAGERIEAYKVVVQNRTKQTLDLEHASATLSYKASGNTYAAPVVIDSGHSDFATARGRLPAPVKPEYNSTGAWLFSVPEKAEQVTIKLFLSMDLPAVYFSN